MTAVGPDLGVAGFCTVTIAGKPFECMRVLQSHPVEPEDCQLNDIYLTPVGRVLLVRVFNSQKPAHWDRPGTEHGVPWQAPGIERLSYNGVEYLHWFDQLSGCSLS